MNDSDFMRYSRQILLEEIAISGQQKLFASRVLIVGLGGLGAPAAVYLAGAGVGTLVLADDDAVHLSNLQRQILFTTEDINQPKTQVTAQRLHQLNPDIELITLQQRLSGEALYQQIEQADVVLDCSDNMQTRQAINAACVALETPLITASAVGFGGQLLVLTPPWQQGCYRCLWSGSRHYGRHAGAGSDQAAQRPAHHQRGAAPVRCPHQYLAHISIASLAFVPRLRRAACRYASMTNRGRWWQG